MPRNAYVKNRVLNLSVLTAWMKATNCRSRTIEGRKTYLEALAPRCVERGISDTREVTEPPMLDPILPAIKEAEKPEDLVSYASSKDLFESLDIEC